MGAFTDLFKPNERRNKPSKSSNSPSPSSHLPQPLWAIATEPTPRPIAGPRSPSKRPVIPIDLEEEHQTTRRLIEEEAARARALQGRKAGEKVRETLLLKRRRRTASLEEVRRGLGRVQLGAPAAGLQGGKRGEQRQVMHGRTQSTPGDVFRQHQQVHSSSTPPRPLPSPPPKSRPGPSSSPSRPSPSPYAQALPTAPRLPPHSHSFPSSPAPIPRGPNPIRQIAPSAPSTAPQSRNTSNGSMWGQMVPGAFPRDVFGAAGGGEQGGWTMPEPRPWDGGVVLQGVAKDDGDVGFLRNPPQQQQQQPTYHPHPPLLPSAPPLPPTFSRPPARPISSSLSAPHLTTTLSTPPRPEPHRKPPPQSHVIDLTTSTSPPSTPSRSATKNQCHGTTGTGKRCTRSVANTPGSTPSKSTAAGGGGAMDQLEEILGDGDGGVVRFCFQHAKQAMGERGCFVSPREGRSKWVEFDDWILPDLPTQTKILLRHEMAMPVSAKDEEGYIYVHEMVPRTPTSLSPTTHLKLGRSIHPVTRLSQWRSQCPSRDPIVRGIFPRLTSSSSFGGVGVSGALKVADRGTRNHHRWERLVLIEVAGRAEGELAVLRGGGRGGRGGGGKKECADCGRVHLELFEVREGAFDEWVAEVVERWGRWCADVLG